MDYLHHILRATTTAELSFKAVDLLILMTCFGFQALLDTNQVRHHLRRKFRHYITFKMLFIYCR